MILLPCAARAQDIALGAHVRTDTEISAALQEIDRYPLHAGSFSFLPKLVLEQHYDTNILAQSTDEQDDFLTVVSPSLSVFKNIRDHQFLSLIHI